MPELTIKKDPVEPQFQLRMSQDLQTIQIRRAKVTHGPVCAVRDTIDGDLMIVVAPITLPQLSNLIDALTLARGRAVQDIGAEMRNAARKAAGA